MCKRDDQPTDRLVIRHFRCVISGRVGGMGRGRLLKLPSGRNGAQARGWQAAAGSVVQ